MPDWWIDETPPRGPKEEDPIEAIRVAFKKVGEVVQRAMKIFPDDTWRR